MLDDQLTKFRQVDFNPLGHAAGLSPATVRPQYRDDARIWVLRAGSIPYIKRGMAHPNQQLLAEIAAFCAAHEMSEAKFGRLAVKDWKLVGEMRGDRPRGKRKGPRRIWPETEAEIRRFMVTYRPNQEPQEAAA
jgi:hypothetical protein